MDDEVNEVTPPEPQAPRSFLRNPVALAAVAVILAALAYFLFIKTPPPGMAPSEPHLPFGPAEEAYAAKLQLGKFSMSRAENFLHQEVTIISGDVTNTGDRTIQAAEVTLTFRDEMGQIVLRETRPLFPPPAPPLLPGKPQHFDISFDHVPESWNVQVPAVRVTGLQFAKTR
jgi:hypothetical protein